VPAAASAVRQPRTRAAEQPAQHARTRGRTKREAKTRTRSMAAPVRREGRPLRATRGSRVSRPRLRRPVPSAPPHARALVAERTVAAVAPRSLAQPRPTQHEAAAPRRWPLGLACIGLALCALGASRQLRRNRIPARRFEQKALRKMSEIPTGPEETYAEPQVPTDSRRRRLAVCERPAAHRPCRRLRRPLGHLCALSPAAGQRRPHGQRHGRARNARDGRRRRRGTVAA
jgi:hypothetical protein